MFDLIRQFAGGPQLGSGRIGCEVYIDGSNAKSAFQKLHQQKDEIEKSTGPLEWMELPEA